MRWMLSAAWNMLNHHWLKFYSSFICSKDNWIFTFCTQWKYWIGSFVVVATFDLFEKSAILITIWSVIFLFLAEENVLVWCLCAEFHVVKRYSVDLRLAINWNHKWGKPNGKTIIMDFLQSDFVPSFELNHMYAAN